ncbi:MAG: type II secretion system F family protein [Candidatus Doudnabacteria bacterium]|nr:type II secretion system F family protein [bacterium]MDZ4243882.1 type II secretion system F family protein [Candidatus Doudnabacteria bacterium]
MLFDYRAKDQEGVIKKGVVEAESETQASEVLFRNGLTVLSIEQGAADFDLAKYIPFLNGVSRKELVLFSRQLSTLINARVPILQSLDILVDQVSSRRLREVIREMISDIEGGKSLSETIARFPSVFSNLYVSLIKSGELSGTLDKSLIYIADQQEKDYDLISKLRGAMAYPIFIISAIFIVGALMFTFVLPQMLSVLQEAGAQLPLTTRILIFFTNIFRKYWVLLILGFLGAITGFVLYIRSSGGRIIWDAFKLKVPILGKLLQKIYMDRFARNLSTLVAGGIPIVQALDTVAEVVGNRIYREIILEAAKEVETGKSIGAVFIARKEVPKIVGQMIEVGEQTGELDVILGKLANFYGKEVENMIATMTNLLEPVIMILLGLAVAVMVAGILLPIYNVASVQ